MELHAAALRAADVIRSRRRWFLHADNDADGICASAVMAIALARAGLSFQVRHSRQKDAAAYEALADIDTGGFILLDKGSSHLSVLADVAIKTESPVVLIDHHGLPDHIPSEVTIVNPRALGLDGSRDASAATTAVAVALALNPANIDLAGIGLAGATGDWQHRGGWQGWNQALIERATEAGHVSMRKVPALVGLDLVDALTHTRPPTPGLDGDHAAATAFLENLGLGGVADIEELDAEQNGQLLSAWLLQHLATGADAAIADMLTWDSLHDDVRTIGVRHMFRLVDACGRTGHAATGLAWLLGDASQADAVQTAFADYATRLGLAMENLREAGAEQRKACQVIWTDDPALTGMVGGIGMTHELDDKMRPAVILATRDDAEVQVSTRGTHEAVEAGLDLGAAVQRAAQTVARDGGGHPIAAGTVIGAADVDRFLAALDAALVEQSFLLAA
jgi:single-stranded-DNA-specific exonuclease